MTRSLSAADASNRTTAIAARNDARRRSGGGIGVATTVLPEGFNALDVFDQIYIGEMLRDYREFTPETDPSGEHKSGVFMRGTYRVHWHIAYLDRAAWEAGRRLPSIDAADDAVTHRLLVVSFADEADPA